jgi:hypothetical protein
LERKLEWEKQGDRGERGVVKSVNHSFVRTRRIRANLLGWNDHFDGDPAHVSYEHPADITADLEIRFTHVLMLLNIKPKIQRVLRTFTLKEDLRARAVSQSPVIWLAWLDQNTYVKAEEIKRRSCTSI